MAKICIITNQHLCDNPRVWKEAKCLAHQGYVVTIITTCTSVEKRQQDLDILEESTIEYIAALNLIPGESSWTKRFWHKSSSRIAFEAKLRLGLESPLLLGYAPTLTIGLARKISADLYICHVDQSLYIGKQLIMKGYKVAYDFEDWYSRDYLVRSRPVRLLQQLEQFALLHGIYCTCPSEAMAQALRNAYDSPKKIEVIYNGFSISENDNMASIEYSPTNPSLVWFSQTIGPGRGLETLLESLSLLSIPVCLKLIGDCAVDYREYLEQNFPYSKGHQLSIHDRVLHHDLLAIIKNCTIGLAIEDNFPDNKNTTVSNKILQYVQAGVKVLATSTKGQQEIAVYYPKSIKIVEPGNASEWAQGINFLLSIPLNTKDDEVNIFNDFFSWEAQEKKLLRIVEYALSK